MATWNSRGLRGSTFEDLINQTNEYYHTNELALVQKIPTPITPIEIDKKSRHITLAYFDKKSTVDYIGVVQGVPICFDAKECDLDTFPLANIHEHQMLFMEDFEGQGGVAFFLIFFTKQDRFYYMTFEEALTFWNRAAGGGRKSIRKEELREEYFFDGEKGFIVPYLKPLKLDLESREIDIG